ncbi:hypothetical protein CFC21_060949 [Triticum aestivum]|uniref:DUF4220 domain-containing protein n=3 Tax=Triticinae TaxID=1648030 RepID=A0A3B6JFE1_WHEAT|nr:uncharacterized protein LOC123493430 [Aegilops tauschii subsp. strangulata]KAF7052929.1 hypothetical protein CFC21_060949 [Triticum aestivum]
MAGRARATGIRGNSGDGPKKRQREEMSLNRYAAMQAYLLMGVTGLGYLALLWSTVVLLGGFVTALGKKDFWCLTAISMIQAARFFNDWEEKVMLNFFMQVMPIIEEIMVNVIPWIIVLFPLVYLLMLMLLAMEIIYLFGSFICVGVSLWRIIQRDYGNMDGDSTNANLMPAMDIFYSLVLCQGALFTLWLTSNIVVSPFITSLQGVWEFPEKWGRRSVLNYLFDTRSKCWRDPKSIKDRGLLKYAVDLLDSESSQDYLSGTRMLDVFIKHEEDVRPLILPSSQKVQKMIDILRWRSSDREMQELVARILAHLACDIDLTQFPGAIRCISSLLGTTLPYWNNQQASSNESPKGKMEQQGAGESPIDNSEVDRWNELILQGLAILERLASDCHAPIWIEETRVAR